MKVVELNKADICKILELYSKNFADGWTENMLIGAFNSNRFIALGLQLGEKLIGLITCSITIDDADIEGVVVANEFRRNGYAQILIDELEKTLFAKNITKIFLEVREGNLPAISLYTKNGYKKISVRKKYYSDGENAVIMAKG